MSSLASLQTLQAALSLHQAGRLDQAEPMYRQVLAQDPKNADALHRLGFLLHQRGRSEEGLALVRQSIELSRNTAHYYNNLGEVLKALGQLDEAKTAYEKALSLKPYDPIAANNLGTVLAMLRRPAEAAEQFRRAVGIKANYFNAWNNLGNTLQQLGRAQEAIEALRKAVSLAPNHAPAYENLALVYKLQGRIDDVIACCRRVVELTPRTPAAWNNLGSFLKGQGRVTDALTCLKQAAMLSGQDAQAWSNYLLLLHYDPRCTPEFFLQEHLAWALRFAGVPMLAAAAKQNAADLPDTAASRRLRIGYVSPHFSNHALAWLLEPVVAHHDHAAFEIFFYSDVKTPDDFTERFKAHADVWRDTGQLSDDALAGQIRDDGIDILVDLTAHMDHNRMLALARKPAPIQASWLAYPATTGLRAIDYRISDVHIDPPGLTEKYSIEKLARLPNSFWCYAPRPDSPDVSELPCLQRGYITFGSLNNFVKINPDVIAVWARVLAAVPNSRLELLLRGGAEGNASVVQNLAAAGIPSNRLTLHTTRSPIDYLKLYHGIDIALDPFPINGHVTSIDALWMGVPVITLQGQDAMGRAGVCLLKNVNHPELIAATADEYVQKAAALAKDTSGLAGLRSELRGLLEKSPIMDAPRFARDLEALYHDMWNKHIQP